MVASRQVVALVVVLASMGTAACGTDAAAPAPGFTKRVLVTDLGNPYEIVMGPDGMVWATEKSGKRIIRVDPATAAIHVALELPQANASPNAQDGVLGLALHPDLLRGGGRDHVYVSYSYLAATQPRLKIVRYTYDGATQRLGDPVELLSGLPSGIDHQAARLRFGPDRKLYYAIGDQGANQFDAKCQPIQAQRLPTAAEVATRDWTAYQGKTLRLELDGSIPADNPVLNGVTSHVFSYGHRNGQGLDFGDGDRLYQSEQGPKTDDEINIIRPGGNYGWPHVAGYRDDKAYTYANWSASNPIPCADLDFSDLDIPYSVPQQQESEWPGELVEPIRTFDTVDTGHNFADPRCAQALFICWPTLAISSLTYYPARPDGIPGWSNSLLITNLKDGSLHRLTLTPDGTGIAEVTPLFKNRQRYRDTAVSADGRSIFIATDLQGMVRDADGAPTSTLTDRGAIIEYRWNS